MKKIAIFILFITLFIRQNSSTVIGIDLGNEYFKISLISPGKSFQIVENSITKRKTETSISFVNGERFFEQASLNKRTKFYKNTFVNILKYLGEHSSEEKQKVINEGALNRELHDYEYENGFKFKLENFKLNDENKDNSSSSSEFKISAEEIASMILNFGKQLAEKQSQTKVVDCVIIVNPLSSVQHRLAIYKAALIAGLTPLSFMGENAAAALQMTISRNDLSNVTDPNIKNRIIMYNLGSSGLKVSIVEIGKIINNSTVSKKNTEIQTLSILADAFTDKVSALLFDQAITDIVISAYNEKNTKNLADYPSAILKILKEANRFKETLSANKQATFFVENVLDNEDLKVQITRDMFENKCEIYFSELIKPLEECLIKSGLQISNIDGIEVLGGAVRIPKVQQVLRAYLDQQLKDQEVKKEIEVSAHLNGDESMAFGAAFMAANISTIYRVRPVHFYDGYEFDIQVIIKDQDDFYKQVILFPRKTRFGTKKSVAFQHDKNVQIEINKLENGVIQNLIQINITNLTQIYESVKDNSNITKPKVNLQLKLTSIIPVEITGLDITSEETKEVTVDKLIQYKQEDNTTIPITQKTTENQTNIIRFKIEKQQFELLTFNQKSIEKSQKLIERFVKQEQDIKLKAESKNKLETIIYLITEKLADEEYIKYMQEEEKEQLLKQQQENDDWLYSDEADNSDYFNFKQRANTMQSILDKVQFRQDQHLKRPEMINDYVRRLENVQIQTREYYKKNDWLNQSDVNRIHELIEQSIGYIDVESEKQEKKPLNQDPILLEYMLKLKLDIVQNAFQNLKLMKKPIPKKQKKADQNTTETQNPEQSEDKQEQKDSQQQEETQEQEQKQDENQNQQQDENQKQNQESFDDL